VTYTNQPEGLELSTDSPPAFLWQEWLDWKM